MFNEKVIPLRYCKNGLIVCRREGVKNELKNISIKLQNAVSKEKNETEIQPNTVYALKQAKQPWKRSTLKFVRDENVHVMQFLDFSGVVDVGDDIKIRKIRDHSLREMNSGIFKMFIYGICSFEPDAEFESIFDQILKNQTISALFTLVEKKDNVVHECFVGDIFYKHKEKLFSFRECLIRQKFTYPTQLHSENNRKIFEAVVEFLQAHNGVKCNTISKIDLTTIQNAETPTLVPTGTLVKQGRDLIPTFVNQVDDFGLIEIIGEGTYGVVYKAWSIPRREFVAIKFFRSSLCGMSEKKEVMDEASILRRINSKHVIQLYELKETDDQLYLVFPYCAKDLCQFIYDDEYIHDSVRTKKIIFAILSGLRDLHNIGIVHRDIKPSNVLLNIDGDLKICDLGLSSQKEKMMSECGTDVYMAPEMFLRTGYDRKVDIWAAGCILAELILKKRLVGYSKENQLEEIFKVFGTPKRFNWPFRTYTSLHDGVNVRAVLCDNDDFQEFFQFMMTFNPAVRCDASTALEMTYLKESKH